MSRPRITFAVAASVLAVPQLAEAADLSARIKDVLIQYAITFGWALTGAISMGISVAIMLTIFTWSTKEIDEWKLVSEGNTGVSLIISSLILACAIVVAACVIPQS